MPGPTPATTTPFRTLFGAGMIGALPDEVFVEAAAREPVATRGRVEPDGGRPDRAVRLEGAGRDPGGVRPVGVRNRARPGGPRPSSAPFPPRTRRLREVARLDTAPECDALVSYVRDLPAPIQLDPSGPSGSRTIADGRHLFESVGCQACHTPSLGPIEGIYSDLYLHDIGLTDDGIVLTGAKPDHQEYAGGRSRVEDLAAVGGPRPRPPTCTTAAPDPGRSGGAAQEARGRLRGSV